MSGPIQTVNFIPPAQIQALTQQVTPTGITTSNLTATGTISGPSITNLQNQLLAIQNAIAPTTPQVGGIINTLPPNGINTPANQQYRSIVDDQLSQHVYELGGLTSQNLQYLQLDSTASIPSSLGTMQAPCVYQNTTGTYFFGSSSQVLYYTGTYVANGLGTLNLNRQSRREQFNLLQDLGSLTGSYAGGYTGFSSAWAGGFPNVTDIWRQQLAVFSPANIAFNTVDPIHWFGNYSYIWRYDTTNKTVIARSVVNMTKSLWGSSYTGSPWLLAASTDGFITSLNNGSFVVNISSPSSYGILMFDINLNPLNILQSSSYGDLSSNDIYAEPLDFQSQAESYKIRTIQRDQIRGSFVKQWYSSQLSTGVYTSLVDGSSVNVFNSSNPATFLYVWSSSQASYNSAEAMSNFNRSSCMTPLANSKWANSSGKLTVFAICTGAPSSPTGIYASTNGQYLVPIMRHQATPDPYVAGDTFQLDSLTIDPLTQQYNNLNVKYPLVDIRDEIVFATGTFRNLSASSTGSWREGYTQYTFYTGSSTGARTAGLQHLCVSVACITGSFNAATYAEDNLGTGTLNFPNNRRYYQDVFSQYYYRYTDSTGTFFQQNYLFNATLVLTDPEVKFYVSPSVQYLDTKTNIMYVQQPDGTFKNSGNPDPSPNASIRQLILNNGFAVRYSFAAYDLKKPFNAPTANATPTAANPWNPQVPPNITNESSNNGPQFIYADFNFPDNHKFDSTASYVSEPWDLVYTDWCTYTGSYAALTAPSLNVRYGVTGVHSATGVRNFFNSCQNGLTSNVINILLPGDSYTGVNNPIPQTVPVGKVVYQVLGEVFNGQPINMNFTPANANNAVLTDWMAKQLNYYGGGIYGNPTLWLDSTGNEHIIVGHGNYNDAPVDEQFATSNYAARQFIYDQQNGLLPCSSQTLQILGIDSIVSTPGDGPYTNVTQNKYGIYNSNGKFVFDCSIRGITWLWTSITNLVNGLTAVTSVTMPSVLDGSLGSVTTYAANHNHYKQLWGTNAYGIVPSITGQQFLEIKSLVERLYSYHTRYMSNRKRACLAALTAQLNAKTLQVEQIIRGPLNVTEVYSTIQSTINIENQLTDGTTANNDEVEAGITAGSTVIYQKGKLQHKMWKKVDAEAGPNAMLVSYNGKSRFAASYDGKLGAQFDKSATGSNLPTTSTVYGNVSELYPQSSSAAGLNSNGVAYAGKLNGKDVFVSTVGAAGNIDAKLTSLFNFTINTVKTNNAEPGNVQIANRTTSDGLITSSFFRTGSTNTFITNTRAPATAKLINAFSYDEINNKLSWNYVTQTNILSQYQLNNNTGAVGTFSFASVDASLIQRNNIGGAGSGLNNFSLKIVNDLIIFSHASVLKFFRATDGVFLGSWYGNDYQYDDSYLPNTTNPTTNVMGFALGTNGAQEVATFNQMVYLNGGNLYVIGGGYGRSNCGAYGRSLMRFNLKYNTPQAINLTSLFVATGSVTGANNSQNVVFTPTDAQALNSGLFSLITTFKTTDYYNRLITGYTAIDEDYDALFVSGITAIAVYDPTSTLLAPYQAVNSDMSYKFVNGGAWYQRTGISFKNLLASGVVKFLYAGQILYNGDYPYKITSPSSILYATPAQIQEATQVRRQKRLLQEYYRAKGQTSSYQGYGLCGPYPDNGIYYENNQKYWSTIVQKPYWNWATPKDESKAVTYNQPLGYTDVGTGRPLTTPL